MSAPNIKIIAALSDIADAFPNARLHDGTLDLYARKLADLDPDLLIAAIERLINTTQPSYYGYFPSIAEIREMVVAGGTTDGAAELAWSEVLREVRRVGWNPKGTFRDGVHHDPPKPTFTSPITQAAVESLTWRLICLSEQPEEVRKQFYFTWKNLAARMLKQAQNGETLDALGETNLRMINAKGQVA